MLILLILAVSEVENEFLLQYKYLYYVMNSAFFIKFIHTYFLYMKYRLYVIKHCDKISCSSLIPLQHFNFYFQWVVSIRLLFFSNCWNPIDLCVIFVEIFLAHINCLEMYEWFSFEFDWMLLSKYLPTIF